MMRYTIVLAVLLAACGDPSGPVAGPYSARVDVSTEQTATQGCSITWTVGSDAGPDTLSLYYETWDPTAGYFTGWRPLGLGAGRTWVNGRDSSLTYDVEWIVGIGPAPATAADSANPDVHSVPYLWKHQHAIQGHCPSNWQGPA